MDRIAKKRGRPLFATKVQRIRGLGQIEGREWWLWGCAVLVTLILTLGILALTFPGFHLPTDKTHVLNLKEWVRALAALVLLFDIYTLYQHLQLQHLRSELADRDRLFELITENAADMIALIDSNGDRLYNSPAYSKILGYSEEELHAGSPVEQIHPDDRVRVLEAAEKARRTGRGERLEYRIRHKDGSWRVLESTASAIIGEKGENEGLVIVNRDVSDRKRAEEMLAHNAFHDSLTNLPNRALFLDRVGQAIAISGRHNMKFAVLFIDIDGFKVFNDSLGHAEGDSLLLQISQRMTACLRRADTISRNQQRNETEAIAEGTLARPGGDEFAVLLEELRGPSDAVRVAERIQAKLAVPFEIAGQKIVITASIGIVFSRGAGTNAEDLIRDAEIAMYRAKHTGKARYQVFDDAMHTGAVHRLQLETDMRTALESGEFQVFYQPIVSLESGFIVGFEALSRWQKGDRMIMPQDFIPVANETGMILTINQDLMLSACHQLRSWQKRYPAEPLAVSFNITPHQFAQPELASQIEEIVRLSGVTPQCLHLEITETIAMSDAERSLSVLSQMKTLGVHIEIDDFGTGYSSLSRLQRFPVDTLKIDRAFVSSMDTDRDTHEIVRVIMALAHNLGLRVIAEGIENHKHLELLQELGCKFGQGYLFSRPISAEAFDGLLASNRRSKTPHVRAHAAHSV